VGERRTAGPSTTLRSGRDDKGWGGASRKKWLVAARITTCDSVHPSVIAAEVNAALPFVIPTGAKRSGGICCAPFPNATLSTPEAAVERAVLDGFCDMAHGNVWPCVEICDGSGNLQYAVVGARAQALLLHGALKQALRLR
jgi:hypothetical protein